MSAFEVTCTPPRVVAKRNNEAREPTLVVLGPFTPKAIVVFEGVPVGKTARRQVILRNAQGSPVEVHLTRIPDPGCGLSFEWTSNQVDTDGEKPLEIVWNPPTPIVGKEVIVFTDSLGHKKDVQLILKSIELKAPNRKPAPKLFAAPVKLKLKSPSPPKVKLKRIVVPKKAKASPSVRTDSWSSRDSAFSRPAPVRSSAALRMGSYTSKVTDAVFGPNDSSFECCESADQSLASPRDRPKVGNKENVNPISPLVNVHFSPGMAERTCSSQLANQETPDIYLTTVKRRGFADVAICKALDVSPKLEPTGNPGSIPAIKVSADPSNHRPTVLCVHQGNVKQEVVTATPADRAKFDPSCYSTVTKPTATNKTYLKPSFDSSAEGPNEFQRCPGESLQRHLTFSPETVRQDVTIAVAPEPETDVMLPPEDVATIKVEEELNGLSAEHVHIPINNKTHDVIHDSGSQLSVIAEEYTPVELGVTFDRPAPPVGVSASDVANLALMLPDAGNCHHRTFKIASHENSRSVSVENIATQNVTVTLKTDISLGSLPNLSHKEERDIGLEEDEVERLFKEHEIRAQSSRFNLHEIGRFSDEMVIAIDGGAAGPGCKRAKHEPSRSESEYDIEITPPKRRCGVETFVASTVRTMHVERSFTRSTSKPIGHRTSSEHGRSMTSASFQRSLALKRPAVPSGFSTKDLQEKRVFLYDSDRHLKTLINPDPFAATTTCDPFLTATMYLDQRAFGQYEAQLKKWLNALVTIPADLDTETSRPLDVGKLFDEVKGKELTLAPTKELISSNYYKNRLNSLRNAGIALYLTEEVAGPLRKVRAQIEKQQLGLRSDRNLHLDLVLQRTVLELLLCFNPLWLRLGLEVVFGEQIELQSNRDVVGLSTFIIHRLFRDRYLEARNSKAYNLSAAYAEHMKKFTLRTVLYLLLFLDTAKRRKLIKHNPCLFVRNAPYKETREVLVRFASTLVAGIGDITKHLKRAGYTLSHKQSYLDEYKYAFENLAVDLRDGVRLTRVMEIILLREDLSDNLRVPPISRLQKIHNINLALRALEEAQYQIAGDITAKDICDGHRERTMSLLWQIVYRFRAPKFNAAATVLQRWWRTNWLRVLVARRIDEKRRLRRELAARTIQAAVRGYCVRVWYAAMRHQKLRAAVTMQRFVRRFLAQKLAARRYGALVRIQQWWRSVSDMRQARERYLTVRKATIVLQTSYRRYALSWRLQAAAVAIGAIRAEAKHRHEQAIIIQRSIKSYVVHRRLHATVDGVVRFLRRRKLRDRSATAIQAYQRMRTTRNEFLRLRGATVCIQRRWRECLEARRTRERYLRVRSGAIALQRYFRGYLQMRQDAQQYTRVRHLIIQLQRRRRATVAMLRERSNYERFREAVLCVQRRYRAQKLMQRQVQQYAAIRRAVLVFQHRYRARKLMERERLQYERLRYATLCTQRRFRAQLSMRTAQESYGRLRRAVMTVQERYRATLLMRHDRHQFIELHRYTIAIQCRFRALINGRQELSRYSTLRTATIRIQRKWRATLRAKEERGRFLVQLRSALTIQRAWRSVLLKRKLRTDYLHYRRAATIIQRRFRALRAGRAVRQHVHRQRCAAIAIQRKLRATLAMRRGRAEFIGLRRATVTVQRRFRANWIGRIERTRYNELKRSVASLSTWWYSILAMRRQRVIYQRITLAATVIQQRFRALRSMRQQRVAYERIREATLLIQRRYRAQRAMERCRGRFLNLRSASIVVQEYYRAYCEGRRQRAAFLRVRQVTISIQRRYRGKLLMRQTMLEYERSKLGAITIQRWFRGYQEMRNARERFLSIRRATCVLQAHYRATVATQQAVHRFRQLREAVIYLQIRWRATLAMREQRGNYRRVLAAAATIQAQYRAYKDRLVDQAAYRLYRSAVIIVQRRYREKLATRAERCRFVCIVRTVRGLQRYGRGLLARRAYQAKLTPEFLESRRRQRAALRLQAWWRGVVHRKRHQTVRMRKMAVQMVASRREAERDPTNRVSNVTRLCMRFLASRFSSSDAIGILQRLERLSRLVPYLLVEDAVFLAQFCYNTMAQAIRSELDKTLIEICARIILNLARFPGTKEQAYQEKGLVTVSQMLLRWCDKDCGIFSTLCTLLWVLAHDCRKKNAIRRYMISKDAIFMLRETKKLVKRKENMRKNVQRPPVGCLVPVSPQLMRTVPALQPDYGVDRSKPYVFYSSVFGFEKVLQMLEVDLS
ncbi:protein abnormal spindle [Anopheles bellator]|uniref:protein abnormal spindle n=1 Tax=Anopheles bellator TaxID=139047 RepID=UPI002647B86D|nr:protein abnormal spindle [Anopheles bellator]